MVFAGGLEVIPSRVLVDVIAWVGMSYSIWTPPRWKNSIALLFTVCMILATSGATSRWTIVSRATIIGAPPPSSGGTCVIEALNILENFDLASRDRFDPVNIHLIVVRILPRYWIVARC